MKLLAFTSAGLEPLLQPTLLPTADAILATRDTLLRGVVFPAQTIDEVTAFMMALTAPPRGICPTSCRPECRVDYRWTTRGTPLVASGE